MLQSPARTNPGVQNPMRGRTNLAFSDHDHVEVEDFISQRHDPIHINTDPMMMLPPEGEWARPCEPVRRNEGLFPLRAARQAQ